MKRIFFITLLAVAGNAAAPAALPAQSYGKLNALYASLGLINPQVEFTLSPRMSFQTEFIYSPWRYVREKGVDKPMQFGIFLNEARWFFRGAGDGWYGCANFGMHAFKISKPVLCDGYIFANRYGKGWGMQFGFGFGYERRFGPSRRWIVDAFLSVAWMGSSYNGYSLDDNIDLYPHGHDPWPAPPDPYNGSGEWLPNKIGASIGYLLFPGR
ncbi:MAG: DUF3575 domain-containing protein [Rikenellaceae bacterium]|jgi:hypothetical protein|nr:DUF3575 domain-containing protein [Rikenellaceae bacterium]